MLIFIEKDLNLEIDRLVRLTSEQKRTIAELESQVTNDIMLNSAGDVGRLKRTGRADSPPPTIDLTKSPTKSKKSLPEKSTKSKTDHKKSCKKFSTTKQTTSEKTMTEVRETVPPLLTKCCCEAGGCVKNMKELLDKEMEYRQTQVRIVTQL